MPQPTPSIQTRAPAVMGAPSCKGFSDSAPTAAASFLVKMSRRSAGDVVVQRRSRPSPMANKSLTWAWICPISRVPMAFFIFGQAHRFQATVQTTSSSKKAARSSICQPYLLINETDLSGTSWQGRFQ